MLLDLSLKSLVDLNTLFVTIVVPLVILDLIALSFKLLVLDLILLIFVGPFMHYGKDKISVINNKETEGNMPSVIVPNG